MIIRLPCQERWAKKIGHSKTSKTMDLLILLPKLNMALGTQRLVAVVVGDELVKTLEIIGDVNYRAALRALRDARTSRNPRREFERAVTCFVIAYEAYKPSMDGWLELVRHAARCTLMSKKVAYSYKKASEAALYTAICYWVLREGSLVKNYCRCSHEAFNYYAWHWHEGRFGSHRSPWGKSKQLKEEEEELHTTMTFIENTPLEL
jgi:hypothetical protein